MSASDLTRACSPHCMPDCEETTYAHQVDTTELDEAELCAKRASLRAVMDHWRHYDTLLSWLMRQFLLEEGVVVGGNTVDPEFEIEAGLVAQICRSVFRRDVALVTLEIVEPRVMQISKDVKATFPDMLGTIGERTLIEYFIFCLVPFDDVPVTGLEQMQNNFHIYLQAAASASSPA